MEQVIRIVTKRRGEMQQVFEFTTYNIIFNKDILTQDNNFGRLIKWLAFAFVKDHPNFDGYETASQSHVPKPKAITRVQTNFAKLAFASGYEGKKFAQHKYLQLYFLNNDPETLAVEVPVWLTPDKTPNGLGWAGMIDILRVDKERGVIQVLDFKPNASKEKHTSVGPQLYRYVYMLHKLTGIPLVKFEAYFFDKDNTYQVFI